MNIEELLEQIKTTAVDDVKLYFVTRVPKAGVSKRTRATERYLFKVYQMDCNDEVRTSIYNSTLLQLEKVIEKKYELIDYDILTDDTEHLFTYPIHNKVFSFSDVVTNQLLKESPKVTSIIDISSDSDEMWAYCVEFCDVPAGKKYFTFRKILPSKVGVDEKAKKFVRAFFNTKSQQLCLLKEETVNLDEQIDCVYHEDTFYVLKKNYFEQIMGLQEEYKERAGQIADNMIASGILSGGDKLKELIEKKPSIHKKLIRVEKIGGYKDLTPAKIKAMGKICKKYGDNLPVKEGNKLSIESEEDIEAVLKALGDYYKKGEISGKPYGTFSGKELQTV